MISKGKVTIIGAGNVGSTCAYTLAIEEACHEIILLDIDYHIAVGKALDIQQAAVACDSFTVITPTKNYKDVQDSDIVVVTAGTFRKEGMKREDLVNINSSIIKDIILSVKAHSPGSIVVMVTNPLDIMTYLAIKVGKYPKNQVFGMGGILDSARMASFLQAKLGRGFGQIKTNVIGNHSNRMIPLMKLSSMAGMPISDFLDEDELDAISEKTKYGGAEIIKYLKTSSAYYAPARSIAAVVVSILRNVKKILPVATLLDGEYGGHKDVVTGVLATISSQGVENIVEVNLTDTEQEELNRGVDVSLSILDTLRKKRVF